MPLRARIAWIVATATAALALVAMAVAVWTVRNSLQADLRDALRRDALAVAAAYDGVEAEPVGGTFGPTGRVRVQLYGPDGALFAASDPEFERVQAALPSAVVREAPADWRGRLLDLPVQAATAPFRFGTVAVLAENGYVEDAVAATARAAAVAALLAVVLAAVVGRLAARAAVAPVRRLAEAAARRGPEALEPLQVAVPDDEVGRLSEVLDDLLARLRTAGEEQRRFLAETSHELRTPLTALRGFLRRAERRSAEDEAQASVTADLRHAERVAASMQRLVEDLLELARGRSERRLELHLVDLDADVVVPVLSEFPEVQHRPGAAPPVLGEPQRLRQVARNLLANAVRAAGPEGQVRIRTVAEASAAEAGFEVSDDGPGIDAAMRERLFEPFRPGPGGGAGLGLAIADTLVRAHGGRLQVDSVPGATRITVWLPVAELDEEDA